jgi:predicted nicotinamide N-methyase
MKTLRPESGSCGTGSGARPHCGRREVVGPGGSNWERSSVASLAPLAAMTASHRVGKLPRRVPLSHRRAIVARHTRLQSVEGLTGVRLHLADELSPVWRATEAALGIAGPPIPFWAFAWAGGLAIVRFLEEHPDEVNGQRVVDLATGSGLCAISAMRLGAAKSSAIDVDPFAEAAVALNARANGVKVGFIGRDVLDEEPPDTDVLLAGDTWYEGPLAARALPWLRRAAARGTRVLIGDPGRRYLPAGLVPLASYDVTTTTQLEDRAVLRARVFTLAG